MCTAFKVAAFIDKTYKMALYLGADLNPETPSYTTTNEIVADGYTAGGLLLTMIVGSDQGTAFLSFDSAVFNSNDIVADAGLVYDAVTGTAFAVLDFGGIKTSNGATFTVAFPPANAANALLRIE
jgi:hypothetical protein